MSKSAQKEIQDLKAGQVGPQAVGVQAALASAEARSPNKTAKATHSAPGTPAFLSTGGTAAPAGGGSC